MSPHRGPVREPGGDSLAGTFREKRIVYLGSFLDPEDINISSLGNNWRFSKGRGLS